LQKKFKGYLVVYFRNHHFHERLCYAFFLTSLIVCSNNIINDYLLLQDIRRFFFIQSIKCWGNKLVDINLNKEINSFYTRIV
jgi:hypothetical protein